MSDTISKDTASELMAFHVWLSSIVHEYGRTTGKDRIASGDFKVGNLTLSMEITSND